jgi:uncharacterized membrane protein
VNRNLAAWLAAGVAMLVADLLWLGVVARPLYARGLAHLMAAEPTLWAAALFYAVYGLGLLRFAIAAPGTQATAGGVVRAVRAGALFGFVAYSTYDLTNLATLKDWPAGLAFVDIGWGMLASAAAAAAGRLAWQRFSPR